MFFSANSIFASDERIENDRKITRKIAITMDGLDLTRYQEIINIIKKFDVKLTIFVNENLANEMTELHKVQDFSEDKIVKIFKIYHENGVELGNHTFDHKDPNVETFDEFKEDVEKGENLIKKAVGKIKYFRFPFLSAGDTSEKRREINKFLTEEKNYVIAPITIDTIDWKFEIEYRKALEGGDREKMKKISQIYLNFAKQIIKANEDWSLNVFDRNVRHILLIHQTSQMTLDNLGAILQIFKDAGYKFVSLDEAMEDKIYKIDTVDCCSGGGYLYRASKVLNKLGWYKANKDLWKIPSLE
jgi:peptidoglycan/xylan/chitin deacetylase (PgdA/CDA1 family)